MSARDEDCRWVARLYSVESLFVLCVPYLARARCLGRKAGQLCLFLELPMEAPSSLRQSISCRPIQRECVGGSRRLGLKCTVPVRVLSSYLVRAHCLDHMVYPLSPPLELRTEVLSLLVLSVNLYRRWQPGHLSMRTPTVSPESTWWGRWLRLLRELRAVG